MKKILMSLNANQLRFAYDICALLLTTTFCTIYSYWLFDTVHALSFAAVPIAFLLQWAVGIYGRHGLATGVQKSALFFLSISTTSIFIYFVSNLAFSVLWLTLTLPLLALPRIFLNLASQNKTGILGQAARKRGHVLIVGGAGYIGTHLVEQLLAAKYEVKVLDTLFYGRDPMNDLLTNSNLTLIEGNATDILKLTEAMHGASAVIHLAGLVGDPACAVDENFTRHVNVIATRMVKDMALSLKVPRFIFASSCSVYGINDQEVTERSSPNPVSLYARTKIDSEQELLLAQDEDFCVTILRFATVFGHSRRPRFDLVANLFTAQSLNSGKMTVLGPDQWRPFIHVSDVARAIVKTLQANPKLVSKQIFNVGDSRLNMTIGNLAKAVQSVVSKSRKVDIEIKESKDLRNYLVSFEKIKSNLGFQCQRTIEQGIAEMVAEFNKGTYLDYLSAQFSNLQMTGKALEQFQNPAIRSKLYQPLSEGFEPSGE